MFALNRIDDQVLTREVVVGALRRVQGAFKSLPQHGRLSIRRADRASITARGALFPPSLRRSSTGAWSIA